MQQFKNKNLFLTQFLLFSLPVCLMVVGLTYFAFSVDKRNKLSVIKSEDKAAVDLKQKLIEGELGIAKSDLKTFVSNNDLFSYWTTGNKKYLYTLEREYLNYTKSKNLFERISVIDAGGQELLRISYKEGKAFSVRDTPLQNVGNEKYFKQTSALTEDDVYISQLDLKRTDDGIVKPFQPIIRFGIPLFGFDEKRTGVIILDYNAERFLRLIDEPVFGYYRSQIMLLNSTGYFLHSNNADDEWGFLFEERNDITFYNKYENVWPDMSTELTGQVETEDGIFTFNTVYPIFGYNLQDMLSQSLNDVYSWKLVSFIPRASLNEAFSPIVRKWFFIGLFFIISSLIAIGFISALRAKNILARQQIEYHLANVTNLNSQLQKSEKHLLEENKNKDRFISILSHDLKNPLGTLRNFSNLLKDDYDEMQNDERKDFINSINDIAENTVNLLLTLLDWSRLNLGTMEFTPENLVLGNIIQHNLSLFKYQAENKNISLISEVDKDMEIFTDENMLNTLLRNFISNAIKFTKPGGYVKVFAIEKENTIELCVEDNGVGMSETQMEKVCGSNKRHSTQGTMNEAGTGLGLKLCKELIEKQNGTVHFQSEEGKGSKFCLGLPKNQSSS